jgi:hypothetical protein
MKNGLYWDIRPRPKRDTLGAVAIRKMGTLRAFASSVMGMFTQNMSPGKKGAFVISSKTDTLGLLASQKISTLAPFRLAVSRNWSHTKIFGFSKVGHPFAC